MSAGWPAGVVTEGSGHGWTRAQGGGCDCAPRRVGAHQRRVTRSDVACSKPGRPEKLEAAIDEALAIGRATGVPLTLSHHQCTGAANFGKAPGTLAVIDRARRAQPIGLDAYPYHASSKTLDPGRAQPGVRIMVTWSTPHPRLAGRMLDEVAAGWGCSGREAAERLLPAGAIYFLWRAGRHTGGPPRPRAAPGDRLRAVTRSAACPPTRPAPPGSGEPRTSRSSRPDPRPGPPGPGSTPFRRGSAPSGRSSESGSRPGAASPPAPPRSPPARA
jgi:hypothetical protein